MTKIQREKTEKVILLLSVKGISILPGNRNTTTIITQKKFIVLQSLSKSYREPQGGVILGKIQRIHTLRRQKKKKDILLTYN